MPPAASRKSGTPSSKPNQALVVRRLRFLAEPPAGAKVRRQFKHPRRVVAVEEVVEPTNLPGIPTVPEPTDQCWIVFASTGTVNDALPNAATWLAPPDQPDAAPTVTIERDGTSLQWRPGRALVQGRAEHREDILTALTDFAFYEGELRALELDLEAREPQAREDVARTYAVGSRACRHGARLKATMEHFAQMRLTFARLEPCLAKGARSLPVEARRLIAHLLHKADVEARLEALSDRLEAMEDLYEGAVDRVADHRMYRHGHWLEVIIIALLMLDVVLISGDMYIRYLDYKVDVKVAETEKAADMTEEYWGTVTKVADGRVTYRRLRLGDEQTLPVADKVKVVKGKLDKETGEPEAGEPITGGLDNPMFLDLGDKGLRVFIITDATNKKIAQLYVYGPGKKAP